MADAVDVGRATIERIRQRFVEEGLEAGLTPRPGTRVYVRKIDGEGEARLVTLACSKPSQSRNRWTLRLLADQLIVLGYGEPGLAADRGNRVKDATV